MTLHGEYRIGDLLKELSRQSGNVIVDRRADEALTANDPILAVDFQEKPFWQALDDVLDRAELDVDSYASSAGLAVVPRSTVADRRRIRTRPYRQADTRQEPTRFEAINDLRRPANRSLKLFVEVEWEPRLRADYGEPATQSRPGDRRRPANGG